MVTPTGNHVSRLSIQFDLWIDFGEHMSRDDDDDGSSHTEDFTDWIDLMKIRLLCRSPWSNRYDPPLEDGAVPSDRLRRLEEEANQVFEQYKQLYYEGGVSSVYLWELSGTGFAGVVLIKKVGSQSTKINARVASIYD